MDSGSVSRGKICLCGIGAAVWGALSLLVALFMGGMVATRAGVVFDRTVAMVQGALVWVLAIVGIIIWLDAASESLRAARLGS